jgi:hypothetical protein
MTEIIDIVNDSLQMQKHILIRGERSLLIVPNDEKIDPGLLPRVQPEDLDKRGQTELVSVVIPLRSLVADDLGPEIKKLLGPFGEVAVLKKANQLLIQDTASNLRRIYQMIKDLEAKSGKEGSRKEGR